MSTVLLMTDTWHPTVLRLVPFSSNNAKVSERRHNGRHHNARGFPVLAVTRGANKNNSASSSEGRSRGSGSSRSLRSAQSDYHNFDNGSEISAYTARALTERSEDRHSKHQKYPQKKIPVAHSEMKEAIRFSVQDLNDQVSSCSSMQSTDDSDSKVQKADNTRTALPKPSLCSPSEAKHVVPVNGVRRSVPLTPGELELQRIRDSYIVEQSQKRKKYKLNVNQLPRSTTPINDHDPDKLNMKQVIAFLQTKTGKENDKKSGSGRKSESRRTNALSGKRTDISVVSVRQKLLQDMETSQPSYQSQPNHQSQQNHQVQPSQLSQSRGGSETRYVDKTDNTRDINGCVSVLSTKSTPNLRYGQHTSCSNRTTGANSVRSFGNRNRTTKSSSRNKPVKEFKLYRFLAVAPDSEVRQGLATTVTDSVPNVDITTFSYRSQKNGSPDSPRKFLRKKTRDTTTANLIHRRMVNKNGNGPTVMAFTRESQDAQTIRLPSMVDSPDEDAETCSTTSATYNSGSVVEKVTVTKLPKKEKTISFSDEKQTVSDEKQKVPKILSDGKHKAPKIPKTESKVVKTEPKVMKTETKDEIEDENNNSVTGRLLCNFQSKTFKSPDFPRVSINGPRQIHVNMPQEDKKGYSQEIVRLTLRQEKSTTRVTSYMSDMQAELAGKWHEVDKFELTDSSNNEGKDWDPNTPRNSVNSLGNNNFIKVRQKLKSSNLST